MNPFKVSDKVVYVRVKLGKDDLPASDPTYCIEGFWPVENKVYCVDEIVCDGLGLRLVGSTVYFSFDGKECGWHYQAFRKLEEIQERNRLKKSVPEPVSP